MLRNHVAKPKGSRSRSAITYPLNTKGSGRKGGQKRPQRLYHPEKPFQGRDEENASKNPFTQIWQNNNPSVICSVNMAQQQSVSDMLRKVSAIKQKQL